MRASPSGRAGRPTDQAPSGLGDTATIPDADRVVGYRSGSDRNEPDAIDHTYAMMANGDLWPMCGYGWNRAGGAGFSIFRGSPGTEGDCKLCRKNVADAKPPVFDGFPHKTKWL
jgi:hypothetical protein